MSTKVAVGLPVTPSGTVIVISYGTVCPIAYSVPAGLIVFAKDGTAKVVETIFAVAV